MPQPTPVASDAALPGKTGVAVIGGGIIGVATALELASRGIDVALFEKGVIAGEQSGRNWGWCRQMGRDARELPLIRQSLQLWRGMNARVGGETGFRECGILYLCETEKEFAHRDMWLSRNAGAHDLKTRRVTGAEAAALQPGATRQWAGGLYTPDDGRAEPQLAAPAMAEAVRRLGGKVFTGCAVRGIETAAGRVSGIVTEKGSVTCDSVVLAGGAWSRRFLGNLGIPFPQLSVVNSVLRTAPLAGPEISSSAGKFSFRKRLDGGYSIAHRHTSVADILPQSFTLGLAFLPALRLDWDAISLRFGKRFFEELRLKRRWRLDEPSPFEAVRVLDPAPVAWVLDEAAASIQDYFPVFRGMQVAERWAGCIDATPDTVPVISALDKHPGLYLASGFSGHGFGLGPGAGLLMAQMVTGADPCVDPHPFRYSRFFDGSAPRPATGL